MKVFKCLVNDGHDIFNALAAAKNKKEFIRENKGNGELKYIEDVTKDYLHKFLVQDLEETLKKDGWSDYEKDLVCGIVQEAVDKFKK